MILLLLSPIPILHIAVIYIKEEMIKHIYSIAPINITTFSSVGAEHTAILLNAIDKTLVPSGKK